MSTLQRTTHHCNRIRTRVGTGALGLAALIAIGLALLILIPTGHRTSAPTTSSIAQPAAQAAALTTETQTLDGCFRDPATHNRTCSYGAPALTSTPARAGYFRDSVTHELLLIPGAQHRASKHPANHSRGRIIP